MAVVPLEGCGPEAPTWRSWLRMKPRGESGPETDRAGSSQNPWNPWNLWIQSHQKQDRHPLKLSSYMGQ